ncbi:hypothetical protein Tco_0005039 [Tanacetum coccineum]
MSRLRYCKARYTRAGYKEEKRLDKVSSQRGIPVLSTESFGNFHGHSYLSNEGDLKIMRESSIEVTDQEVKDGTVIHMLVERKYPLSKELLQRMLDFRLEVEVESTVALDLIRWYVGPGTLRQGEEDAEPKE